jgi:ribosomal protein S18 acetylase RimI-like enzyme
VLLDGDRLVAFAMAHRDGEVGPLVHMGRTHPAATGRGIGAWMLAFAEEQARARGIDAIRTNAPREDAVAAALFAEHGFARVRSSFDMGRTLDGSESSSDPPPGVTIRPFVRGADERATWVVEKAAFRDHWDHVEDAPFATWEHEWFGGDATTRILLAEADGAVVGEIAWEAVDTGTYVLSVAVLASHRRRGIAGALLRAAIGQAAAEGHPEVYLSVDATNPTGAVGVYERAGLAVWRTVDVFDRALPAT